MNEFAGLSIHMAVVYLHSLLAWRFFPQRHDNFTVYVFWLMMIFNVLLHTSYGVAYLFEMLQMHQWLDWTIRIGYWLLAFLPAFLATLFLGELTEKPVNNKGILVRWLSVLNQDTKRLFIGCMSIAGISVIVSAFTILSKQHHHSFGNEYALLLVCVFVVIWLLMLALGFKPDKRHSSILNPMFRWLMVWLMPLFIGVYFFNFGGFWLVVPITCTVGFSLCFCWSRFRTQFMDVIANQFIRILMAIGATFGFAQLLQSIDEFEANIQKLLLLSFIITLALLYQWLSKKMASLWQPPKDKLESIHTTLPMLLAQCQTVQTANIQVEQYLAELFNTQVSVSQQIDKPVQTVYLEGSVAIEIQLGYLRRWMPWFSQALYWVKTAGLYLQSHLIILQSLEQMHQQKLKTQTLTALAAKAELNAMLSQIRPHFLFNILNSIHCFITTDPKMAEKTVEILSDIMRSVLTLSDKETVALQQEMHIVEQYLLIEKIRYGEQLNYQINIDPDCDDLLIPPFSVQPLVENAIKHGVDAQFEPVLIIVKATCNGQQLLIQVLDDGPGLSQHTTPSGLGIATDNIKNRLDILYGANSEFTLENGTTKGAVATIKMPLTTKEPTKDE